MKKHYKSKIKGEITTEESRKDSDKTKKNESETIDYEDAYFPLI